MSIHDAIEAAATEVASWPDWKRMADLDSFTAAQIYGAMEILELRLQALQAHAFTRGLSSKPTYRGFEDEEAEDERR